MLSLNIPLLMVVAFLLLSLAVGLYFSSKTSTLREYTVGHKQFATATLVATTLATTWGGGALVRDVEQVYDLGLYWISFAFLSFADVLTIIPLTLRMGPFMHHLSMPESIGSVYGKYPRMITALAGIGSAMAIIASQINVMSKAISMCIGSINPSMNAIITILATFILICYSTFGGIRAVTFTDILQFMTFSIIIPLLAVFMLQKASKPVTEFIPFLQSQEKFQLNSILHFDTLIAMVSMVLAIVASIDPTTMQRVYMSSSPLQANKVFFYSGLFSFMIVSCIILTGLSVFVGAPTLLKTEVWPYIIANIPPVFRGCVAISLLAMTISTADSKLNTCSVMISHDILESVRGIKAISYAHPLRLARLTSLAIGLLAMLLAFCRKDLLQLLLLALDLYVPIVTAPFVLAIFGFRGTARTALTGMATGTMAILAWNKWVEPATSINGSFICMLANGLAMVSAHYLLPQPEGTGWVEPEPDDEFKLLQQAKARKEVRRKEEMKASFSKKNCAKLKPNTTMLVSVGMYIIVTTFLVLSPLNGMELTYWTLCQIAIGSWMIAYALFFKKPIPDWLVGRYWFIGFIFCLPIHALWLLGHAINPLFTIIISLAHLVVTLWVLPLYWGIRCVIAVLSISFIIYPIFGTGTLMLFLPTATLLPLLGFGLLVFGIIIYAKFKITAYTNQIHYLKNQRKLKQEHKIKSIAYSLNMYPSTARNELEEDGNILQQVTQDVTQAVSFIDNTMPLSKEDFQSIINKFSEWSMFLKKQAKARDHMLLQPTAITLDALMNKLEVALEREVGHTPRLLIEKIEKDNGLPTKIVCDLNQTIHLLVTVVLRMGNLDHIETQFIKIQLQTTYLQYGQGDPIDNTSPKTAMAFPAIALVVSTSNAPPETLPKVKSYYEDMEDKEDKGPKRIKKRNSQITPVRIDLDRKTIEYIIRAHYGTLEIPNQDSILLVFPWNAINIRNEMISKLPDGVLNSETPITPKEQGDSLMVLMDCHDFIFETANVQPVAPGILAEILLLLRHCYGFKRHPSGQLFYVRAAGIAQLVAEWTGHAIPICAALLYDAVRYTRLPISYIKTHYGAVFDFVENVLSVDKPQEREQGPLQVSNRFKEAINKNQLSVLCIKLAERLYDLRHAADYANREEVKYMAKETLMIDVELAKKYMDPEIAVELATAAQQALEIYKQKQ